MIKFKKLIALACACVIAISTFAGCSGKTASTTSSSSSTSVKKIALLLPGVITDKSWNAGAYNGLMKLKAQGYQVAYTENVNESNMESTYRTYASQGYQLIIGHGFEFGDTAIKIAKQFPKIWFFVFGKKPDDQTAPSNCGFVNQKEYESAYVCGAMAALASKTGTIGYVGGIDGASQKADENAYSDGAKSINANIKVIKVMSGTFTDSAKGKEAALAEIEQGADVILHTCDTTGLGVIEACKSKNINFIGYGEDQTAQGPDLILTSLIDNTASVIADQVNRIKAGTFSGTWAPGLKEKVIDVGPFGKDVPSDIQTKVTQIKNDIISGKTVVTVNYN